MFLSVGNTPFSRKQFSASAQWVICNSAWPSRNEPGAGRAARAAPGHHSKLLLESGAAVPRRTAPLPSLRHVCRRVCVTSSHGARNLRALAGHSQRFPGAPTSKAESPIPRPPDCPTPRRRSGRRTQRETQQETHATETQRESHATGDAAGDARNGDAAGDAERNPGEAGRGAGRSGRNRGRSSGESIRVPRVYARGTPLARRGSRSGTPWKGLLSIWWVHYPGEDPLVDRAQDPAEDPREDRAEPLKEPGEDPSEPLEEPGEDPSEPLKGPGEDLRSL